MKTLVTIFFLFSLPFAGNMLHATGYGIPHSEIPSAGIPDNDWDRGEQRAAEEVTLPADWMGLAGFRAPEGIMLRWSTATERSSAWFKIESRTKGANDWRVLGIVAAAGESSTPRFYTWLHNHPPQGDIEYRLRQIDTYGAESSVGALHITSSSAGELRLEQHKPNPASTESLISITTGETTAGALVITDESGKVRQIVFQHLELRPGTYHFRIDTATLPEGKYFIRLTTPEGDNASDLLVCR